MKKINLFIAFAALVFSLPLKAQIRSNVEKAADHQQIAVDKHQLERDSKELAAFEGKLKLAEKAWKARNVNTLNKLRAELVDDMQREIEQSERKLNQAQKEVKESNSEIRSDNREIRRDKKDASRGRDRADDRRDLARDRHDRRDDIRDRRDDVNDRAERKRRLENQKKIYATLKAYNFSLDGPSKEKAQTNKKLLHSFLATMKADLNETKEELREDKGELREDRRETRDDRRERRERK